MLCFSPWFGLPLKLNLRINRKCRKNKTHGKINDRVLDVGYYYVVYEEVKSNQYAQCHLSAYKMLLM